MIPLNVAGCPRTLIILSEQLSLYSELVKDLAPGKPVMLEFVILTKAKEPVVDRHVLSDMSSRNTWSSSRLGPSRASS